MTTTQQEIVIKAGQSDERLDRYLAALLPDASRSEIQNWIKEDRVTVNGRLAKASQRLNAGDEILVLRPASAPAQVQAESIPLSIAYEDDHLLAVNKPPGMVVHPAPGHSSGTLVNALLARAPALAEIGGRERAGIVHRLDRDTSGVLVVAKTPAAHAALQAQFKARTVQKSYLALVDGQIDSAEGRIEAPIGRDPAQRKRMVVVSARRGGRPAVTSFLVLDFYEQPISSQRLVFTLLALTPKTGRTHQLRVHLAFIKHPIVGDRVYGRRRQPIRCPRQFLHAASLAFVHPVSGATITVEAPLPPDLQTVLDGLTKSEP